MCFAAASAEAPEDPSIGTIEGWYRRLLDVAPGCNVQLSGGEPTVRDDLPEVVALGRALGHGFLQLNTNGLRLAAEPGYAGRLPRRASRPSSCSSTAWTTSRTARSAGGRWPPSRSAPSSAARRPASASSWCRPWYAA